MCVLSHNVDIHVVKNLLFFARLVFSWSLTGNNPPDFCKPLCHYITVHLLGVTTKLTGSILQRKLLTRRYEIRLR